jgi:hypothetical protein
LFSWDRENPEERKRKIYENLSEIRKQDHYKLEIRKMQPTELRVAKNGTIYPENANPTTEKSAMQRCPQY